jgi:uncharacterized protein
MAFYECDSSGLAKRYVDEAGSNWVRAIVEPASDNIVSIADITRTEVTSALARRAREGIITLPPSPLSHTISHRPDSATDH